jgi:hypothetical protein
MLTPFKLRFSNLSIMLYSLGLLLASSLAMQATTIPAGCTVNTDKYCRAELVSLVMTMVQRFAVTCFGSALITYAGGVFPMRVRALAYGVSMNLGRLVMPFIPLIIDSIQERAPQHNPLGTLGLISLVNIATIYYFLENVE